LAVFLNQGQKGFPMPLGVRHQGRQVLPDEQKDTFVEPV
jgi:hypothetical protein